MKKIPMIILALLSLFLLFGCTTQETGEDTDTSGIDDDVSETDELDKDLNDLENLDDLDSFIDDLDELNI